ncbi:hypothetical protein EI77_00347 [Prosthecobacter fusiformis]|uniref:Uncharacterized protein n=1 Tax=Prosthecobacter fusiformis TaxID=48464 RepID=A0A4R7SQU3_9BACT|nr:hypothetical protein EI77_00347 [Prosthecobacter fusiformis]
MSLFRESPLLHPLSASFRCLFCVLGVVAGSHAPLVHGQINDLNDLRQLLSQNERTTTSTGVATPAVVQNPNTFYTSPGPWGKLRCSYIYLEAPKSLVDSFPLPNTRPRWTFPEEALPKLPDFFRKASLSEALITLLLDPSQVVKENGYAHLFPPLPDLEAISAETRAIIYTELSKYPPNEFCVDPVLIVGQTVAEWYRTSKLRPGIISKIEQLSYKRGDTIAFSDVGAILNYAESDSEARAIFKAFTRTRSLMVKVEVDHNTNVDELVSYWTLGMGLRRKDIEPLVQSIIDTDGVEALPLSHLLPSLVRKLMYTYPGLDLAKHGMLPDCHWTSLNFFNYEPHEYLLDSRLATSAVLENFEPVEPPYKYGDVLFFLSNSTGDAFHSCVHLADGIVFTKNGRNLLSPWLLMKLEDVSKIYLYRGDGRIQGFRRKNPDASIPSQ